LINFLEDNKPKTKLVFNLLVVINPNILLKHN